MSTPGKPVLFEAGAVFGDPIIRDFHRARQAAPEIRVDLRLESPYNMDTNENGSYQTDC